MHAPIALLALTAAFFPLATANFWIAKIQVIFHTHGIGNTRTKIVFLAEPPNCLDIIDWATKFNLKSDVSGGRTGVRWEGADGTGGDDVDVIEWTNGMGHFTVYKNRDYAMVNLDNEVVGNCMAATSVNFDCYNYHDGMKNWGNSLIWCKSKYDTHDGNDLSDYLPQG